MKPPLKILYLEDSSEDAELSGRLLKNAGIDFAFKLVDTQEEYRSALKDYKPDLILADHSLFQFNSAEALKIFKTTGLHIPFILVTGTVSEEFAVDILKLGADDYLLKSNLTRLPNAIISSLEKYRLEKERQEYFEKIIANEALMKEAEDVANFGSWEADAVSGEVKWSDGMYRIFDYEPGEVKPGHNLILYHIIPNDRLTYNDGMFSVLPKQDVYSSEFKITTRKEIQKFIFFKAVVKRDSNGRLVRFLGFMQDITEKRKLEKELSEQQLLQQKLITEVTIQAQEKERNELGKELHDNINQVLAIVKMYLGMAIEKEDQRIDLIQRSNKNILYTIEEIRKLSRSLVAPSLGDIGLSAALNELAEEINLAKELHVHIIYELEKDQQKIEKNMELMLYRIAQEQLNNIRKYAKATEAILTLKYQGDALFFSIADNGIGFDPSQKAKGIGLKNINSRVDFYSGKMNIISAPGKGCIVNITIPFNKK